MKRNSEIVKAADVAGAQDCEKRACDAAAPLARRLHYCTQTLAMLDEIERHGVNKRERKEIERARAVTLKRSRKLRLAMRRGAAGIALY